MSVQFTDEQFDALNEFMDVLLAWAELVTPILRRCFEARLVTAVETAEMVNVEASFKRLLPVVRQWVSSDG